MEDGLKVFESFKVALTGRAGNQAIGECPFCGKPKHFYVNVDNGLWDCKVCGKKGNPQGFLGEFAKRCEEELDATAMKPLVEDRKPITAQTFRRWGVGYWDGKYTFPVKDINGKVVDIRTYKLGKKMMSEPGTKMGLIGSERLPKAGKRVYVCEGEWDAMALFTLAQTLGKDIAVVGVPGAGTFKPEWAPWFQDKEVLTFYDNDTAGEDGERTIMERLSGTARSIQYIHWPGDAPQGYDVRDWVGRGISIGKLQGSWDNLHKLLQDVPRKLEPGEKGIIKGSGGSTCAEGTLSATGVNAAFRKWLHIEDPEILKVFFGACFANRLEGEPVWLFLVAPPGGMKSELIQSLKRHPSVYLTTTLTPHAMVSGANWGGGGDPSLLPKLNGKILGIKDWTTILSMNPIQRDEILGIFRDIYDGHHAKDFGNGIQRKYESKFGIIAGVTQAIEAFNEINASLGERFLKLRIAENEAETDEHRVLRALSNANQEVAMRDELCTAADKCLNREMPERLPKMPAEMTHRLVALAQLTAIMRGHVKRNYKGHVLYKPSHEVGTRIAKQLSKLATGVAIYLGHDTVGEEEYRAIRRVALDTTPDRVNMVAKALWQNVMPGQFVRTQQIADFTRLPQDTVYHLLQDLDLLNIVERQSDGLKHAWRTNNSLVELIQKSGAYDLFGKRGAGTPAELPKPKPRMVLKRAVAATR